VKNPLFTTKSLTRSAVIAAVYVVACFLLQAISFGPIQLRVSEAMTTLPMLLPEAIPGLFVGCLLANLFGGYGLPDIVFGSLATLAAALLTRRLRANRWYAILPPILINAVVVGIMLYFQAQAPLFPTMLTVGAGEAIAVIVLGLPLLAGLKRVLKLE
jgi:uncharacterized membrane protein